MTAIRLITPSRMVSKTDGFVFNSVRVSFDGPRTMAFWHDIRFDEGYINTGDKVSLAINGVTVFTGWVLDQDPMLSNNEQIAFRAVGPRARLATVIHKRDGTANVIYNADDEREESTVGWTYAQIFDDIVSRVSNEFIASTTGIEGMDTVAPETAFVSMSVDDCLRYIVEKAGKFGFYITPTRQLRVVNLATTTNKKVYAGEIGQTVDAHPEYDVARANLNFSISNCKTKCTIEGDRERLEGYVNLVPDWNPELEKYWTWYVDELPPEALALEGNILDVFRKYKISGFSSSRMLDRLISDPDLNPYTEYQTNSGRWWKLGSIIQLKTGTVYFPHPVYKNVKKFEGTAAEAKVQSARPVRLYGVIEKNPLTVSFGPLGTAYAKGITSEIYIVDRSLVKENVARPDETEARDDEAKMLGLATQLLDPIKDEAITGTLTLDRLDLGWSLENNLDIENTKAGKWSNINAMVLAITYKLDGTEEETTVRISNSQYLGAGADYAELKRRLIVGQKLKTLERNITVLRNKSVGDVTSESDTLDLLEGDDATEGPVGDGASEVDADFINATVQAAFDAKAYTIQKHDHTSVTQGGPAYADQGAALL